MNNDETVTIPKTIFDEMIRAQSGQFVVGQVFPGHQPTLLTQDQYLFYSGVRALRQTVRELKEGGAQVKVRYIPEIVVYDVTPAEANGVPYQLFTCPVECLGIAPVLKEKKGKRVPADKEADKAAKLAAKEAAKAEKAAAREAAKAEKAAAKAAAKKDAEVCPSGSSSLPEL